MHISQARAILNSREACDIHYWTSKGEQQVALGAVSLSYDTRTGTRNIKILSSGQVRRIRDVCIFMLNDEEVYI